jgi:Zn-dependent protease
MTEMSMIQALVVWTPPVLLAVTLHEVAHGWAARELGDHTAERLGRLSLNPLKHVDPIGTVLVPGLLYVLAGFVFGWAKPVPVTWENLRNPRRDMALVALAGPLANVAMLLVWLAVAKLGFSWAQDYFISAGLAGIMINTMLIVLNLLPVPPLDGSRVVSALLPPDAALQYGRIEPYGLLILLVLLSSGVLDRLMSPVMGIIERLLRAVLGA